MNAFNCRMKERLPVFWRAVGIADALQGEGPDFEFQYDLQGYGYLNVPISKKRAWRDFYNAGYQSARAQGNRSRSASRSNS
jgi:hypothetical protein